MVALRAEKVLSTEERLGGHQCGWSLLEKAKSDCCGRPMGPQTEEGRAGSLTWLGTQAGPG